MNENNTDISEVLRTLEDCACLCEKTLIQENLTDWQREIYELTLEGLNKELR